MWKSTSSETKTGKGKRQIVLPHSTAELLGERQKTALSEWIFPNPIKPELPMTPTSVYKRLKVVLKGAGLPSLRFHDLRHMFATAALKNGMDVKTLSAVIGHVSSATTLDIYTYILTPCGNPQQTALIRVLER